MSRTVGTTVRGIRAPIIKEGDNLVEIVAKSLKDSWETEKYNLHDKDVVGITESLVARAQGNYVTIDNIAEDVNRKLGDEIGVVLPILSRNRFSIILKGLARGVKKMYLLLSYPCDEVGNHLMDIEKMDELGINPYTDVLSEKKYRELFGAVVAHKFTGIDYVQMYREIAEQEKAEIEIILANDPREILKFTKNILTADIHTRKRTKRILKQAGAEKVIGLDDLCTEPFNGSGYNKDYGLLGSNKSTEERIKLFPRNGQIYVDEIQKKIKDLTGKEIEVMIYGDGAFKDPVGKIWELADPVVSPAYTSGLIGTPNELKLKYFADNKFDGLESQEMCKAMKEFIRNKQDDLAGSMDSQGTTPRQLTDLLGSLCDLTSGSGDKGTPIILIQGYFDNYAVE